MPSKRLAALTLAAIVLLAAACGGARSSTTATAASIESLTGTTPSGADYSLRVTTKHRGDLCEHLHLRTKDGDTTDNSHCQQRSGRSIHGLWNLDCTTRDFTVFGTAYARVRSVVLRSDNGAVIRARAIRHGHRRAFLLIAQGAKLPGSVQALATGGTVIRTMKFDSAAELCKSAQGIANPLEVTYPF